MTENNMQFPPWHWPAWHWPQDHWPALPKKIAQWIAEQLEGVTDPDGTLTLKVIQPGILDIFESHFENGNIFVIGEDDDMETETTEPSRLITTLIKVYGIAVRTGETADKLLSRITETIRRTLLAGNSKGRACDGLALNIDCPSYRFGSAPGMAITEVNVYVKYYFE